MRITVCELPADPARLDPAWDGLVEHTAAHRPDLVVLPEMPFYAWLAASSVVDAHRWFAAVAAHEEWLPRLADLGAATVVATRPAMIGDGPRNEAFAWTPTGYLFLHHKRHLPDEDGFWEASWYERGPSEFVAVDTPAGRLGAMVCTEIWFTDHARSYARQGVDVVVSPRATPWSSRGRWLVGGRAAAIMAGAFCASSNRSGTGEDAMRWAGTGWVIDPEGDVLATTDGDNPYATIEVDLAAAEAAKSTYPRYVEE
ncbi:MAG: carbon-nitrogen hydrolase family protein [Acidimicrobiia bacterium]|nr:MAG: carbon-nitrogen hydrolase family protein [Acidimicrobiia bacterium]